MVKKVGSDIEIARAARMKPIAEIAAGLGIDAKELHPFGHTKAKLSFDFIDGLEGRPDGKLVLVTAITPTPAGEGKTTTTVGLGDGLNRIGKKAIICLREPSLGPCFGVKGGAAGGGYAQVVPMEDINLHFTGDFHAIGAANNLLAALVDNRPAHRSAPRRLAPRARHERPGVALDRLLARRGRQRLCPRGRVRHHRRLGGDGDLLPRDRPRRPHQAARQRHRRPYPRPQAGLCPRPQGRRADDGAAQGRADAEPGADAGEQPGLHPWRAVRQHRPWLQLRDRHPHRAQARRLCRDRGRLRRRSRRREVPRHQVPQGRAEA